MAYGYFSPIRCKRQQKGNMRLDLQKETCFIYNFGPYCLKLSTQLNKTKQSLGIFPLAQSEQKNSLYTVPGRFQSNLRSK